MSHRTTRHKAKEAKAAKEARPRISESDYWRRERAEAPAFGVLEVDRDVQGKVVLANARCVVWGLGSKESADFCATLANLLLWYIEEETKVARKTGFVSVQRLPEFITFANKRDKLIAVPENFPLTNDEGWLKEQVLAFYEHIAPKKHKKHKKKNGNQIDRGLVRQAECALLAIQKHMTRAKPG